MQTQLTDPETALVTLVDKIFRVAEWYEENAPIHAHWRKKRVADFWDWVRESGMRQLHDLAISVSTTEVPDRMVDSILATISLGDIALERDLSDPENVELVWQWVLDSIPSLHWAWFGIDGGE